MPRSFVGHPNLILETLPEICEKLGWKFMSLPKQFRAHNEWDAAFCHIGAKDFRCSFQVQQMPGCCAVLTASYIDPEPREPFFFNKVVEVIREAAYEAGFGSLVLTQVMSYEKLKKHLWGSVPGFNMSQPFINAKSGNKVVYLTKDLGQIAKRDGLEIQL